MFATTFSGGAIWWTLTKERQAWCNLQVKLCDLCIQALYKYSSFPFFFYWGPGHSPCWKRILAYFEGHRTLLLVPICRCSEFVKQRFMSHLGARGNFLNVVLRVDASDADFGWVSGRTSSLVGWQVTTYVGKPSAVGQATSPTRSFVSLGLMDE